jgi:hypothetical protein
MADDSCKDLSIAKDRLSELGKKYQNLLDSDNDDELGDILLDAFDLEVEAKEVILKYAIRHKIALPEIDFATFGPWQNSKVEADAFNWIDGFHELWNAVSQGNPVEEAVNPDLRELLEHFQKRFWGD